MATPCINISLHSAQRKWFVLLSGDKQHCYLHTDLVWRANCVGPKDWTGYWESEEAAKAGLDAWMMSLPEFTERYGRGSRPNRIVQVTKRVARG